VVEHERAEYVVTYVPAVRVTRNDDTMRVIIPGGTGLIGRRLCPLLAAGGHKVIVLTRDPARAGPAGDLPPDVRLHGWDTRTGQGWAHLITGDTAVVNLAGENPAGVRWTDEFKHKVLQSRLDATAAVLDAIGAAVREGRRPRALLQASAVGYYGDRGDEVIAEDAPPGGGFRPDVCRRWEQAAAGAADLSVRLVLLRIGIALDPAGGALPKLLRASRAFVSRLGPGRQWVPWVHVDDVAAAIRFLVLNDATAGPYNVSVPLPATNAQLMRAMAAARRRPAFVPVPALALRLALGDMAETVLDSQRVVPRRLTAAGFSFGFTDATAAVRDLLRRAPC
jgi:uncharacterized protein (TIGR01777 family)